MRHIAASLVVLCLAGVSADSSEQISIGETIEATPGPPGSIAWRTR